MCGIAGQFRFDDRPIDRAKLEAMQAAIANRGPDGQGTLQVDRCGLTHARLAIIDLLSGDQPMSLDQVDQPKSAGPLHLVFNGEIYNHQEIRRKLERLGHQFKSEHSDTEVLLYGYRQWGKMLPKHIHGMYAFVIYDEAERELFMVRDRIGKKPLYYLHDGHDVTFASTIAAIHQAKPFSANDIDYEAIHLFMRFGYPFDNGILAGVEEVPPAHWMKIDSRGRSEMQSYWRPPPISKTSTAIGAVAALREVLTEAVNARLEADVELGCFLSGGIDSAVVAGLAQKRLNDIGGDPMKTFCVKMPVADYDESEHAAVVAKHLGTNHTELVAEPESVIDDLKLLMATNGDLTADSSILPTYWLCKATRQHVKAALSGDGGDEMFGGYNRYRAMRLLQKNRWWLQHLPTGWVNTYNSRSRRTSVRRIIEAARVGPEPSRQYQQMVHLFNERQLEQLGVVDVAEYDVLPVPDWPGEPMAIHAAMRWDMMHYLPYELLRKVDRASMAVALEVRCPMLATQVMDLAGHLPHRVLMPGGRPKGLLRALAVDLVPPHIVARKKQGFALPIGEWLRTSLKDDLSDHLFNNNLDTLGIRHRPVKQMFDEHVQGVCDHTHRLFALLQMSLWVDWLNGR